VLAASVSISFFLASPSSLELSSYRHIVTVIFLGYIFLCALLYVCCLLHYGANKVSYIYIKQLKQKQTQNSRRRAYIQKTTILASTHKRKLTGVKPSLGRRNRQRTSYSSFLKCRSLLKETISSLFRTTNVGLFISNCHDLCGLRKNFFDEWTATVGFQFWFTVSALLRANEISYCRLWIKLARAIPI